MSQMPGPIFCICVWLSQLSEAPKSPKEHRKKLTHNHGQYHNCKENKHDDVKPLDRFFREKDKD